MLIITMLNLVLILHIEFQIVFSVCMLVILCYKDNKIIDYGYCSTTTVAISAPIFTISIGVIPGSSTKVLGVVGLVRDTFRPRMACKGEGSTDGHEISPKAHQRPTRHLTAVPHDIRP